jgi:hypothetical protein
MLFRDPSGPGAARSAIDQPDELRARLRRRAARRERLILLALIAALIAVALFGVTKLS